MKDNNNNNIQRVTSIGRNSYKRVYVCFFLSTLLDIRIINSIRDTSSSDLSTIKPSSIQC